MSLAYFIELGRSAYAQLGADIRAGLSALYSQLAQEFDRLVRVLLAVRAMSREWRGPDPLALHDLALAAKSAPCDGLIRSVAPRRLM